MKSIQLAAFMIIFTSANFMFAQDAKMTLTPIKNFPPVHFNVDNDDDIKIHEQSCGIYFSEDGKHSVGEFVFPAEGAIPEHFGLFIDGKHIMSLPCDCLLYGIRVFPESGFFKYGYHNCISDKSYEILCLAGKGELLSLESDTLENDGISDAWFDKIEVAPDIIVPHILLVVSKKQGRFLSWGVDPESLSSMIPLGDNQEYIYKTFSSPNSKSTFRVETEDNYLQTLVYTNSSGQTKTIAGPCKVIYAVEAYKDTCYYATISDDGKSRYYYWNNGCLKTMDLETFRFCRNIVDIVQVSSDKKEYLIKTKDKQYGPFPLANSLVVSGDYSHWSVVVKRTADSKFCFIIDGEFSQEFDDIVKIYNLVRSDSWHTFARRGDQWYRVEISWQNTSDEK